jgi:hypothetical protein
LAKRDEGEKIIAEYTATFRTMLDFKPSLETCKRDFQQRREKKRRRCLAEETKFAEPLKSLGVPCGLADAISQVMVKRQGEEFHMGVPCSIRRRLGSASY